MPAASTSGTGGAIRLGDVVRAGLSGLAHTLWWPTHLWKALRAIAACRTGALGAHQYRCLNCGRDHVVPHSCGNRHCPSCQALKGAQWLDRQVKHLLPVPYFHVVFTLPHDLNPLVQHNQAQIYNLLFASATDTLLEFGRHNLKAVLGITAVLHTWGQRLGAHYHLHCVVTGGGVALDGTAWVGRRAHWLFPVRALSLVFRAKFRDGLQQLFDRHQLQFPAAQPDLSQSATFARWWRRCCRHRWTVYAKRPFAGPQAVLAYLSRYTHRVGITNSRLEGLDREQHTVSFRFKDYAHDARPGTITLPLDQFLHRFCLHILPPRFVKIRHYGLLANRDRDARVTRARQLLALVPAAIQTPGPTEWSSKPAQAPLLVCPYCGRPGLILLRIVRAPVAPAPPICDSS